MYSAGAGAQIPQPTGNLVDLHGNLTGIDYRESLPTSVPCATHLRLGDTLYMFVCIVERARMKELTEGMHTVGVTHTMAHACNMRALRSVV